jgi:DnaJ-class molecular chaperone
MTCPECEGEGVIKFEGCQVTCQKCKGGKTVPTLSEWWALLDTVDVLREENESLKVELAAYQGVQDG